MLYLLARLTEALGREDLPENVPEGSAWRVQLIRAGVSANGNDYPLHVLHEAAPHFEGAKILARSDEDHVRNVKVSAENTIGWIEGVKPNPEGLEGIAIFHGGGKSAEIRESITAAWKLGKRDLVGLSIVADGVAAKAKLRGGRPVRAVEKILSVRSVDVVVNPAAGGGFLQLVAGRDPSSRKDDPVDIKKLLKLIEAKRPDDFAKLDPKEPDVETVLKLAQEITAEAVAAADEAVEKLTAAEARGKKESGGAAQGGEDIKALREAVSSLTETVKELTEAKGTGGVLEQLAEMKFERMFEPRLAEANLPPESRDHILARIPKPDRTVENEEKIAEAIKSERLYYLKAQGFDGPGSAFMEAEITGDAGERFVAAVTGLLTGQDEAFDASKPKETVPRATSLKEAYIYFTGDTKCSGRIPRGGTGSRLGALYAEAAATLNAQFSYALGDSITRAMMREYREHPLQEWRKISEQNPANDFRTQHRTNIGGFPTLSTVSAGADYAGFTDVPDDFEATYAVSKKGNTQDVTLEMITNDDVGAVRRIPRKIARAALRTISSAVWTPITSNAALAHAATAGGADTTALFTVAHGNTTASFEAMSLPSMVKGRTSMMKQTEIDGVDGTTGERLNISPKYAAAAVDLEQTMFELIFATGQPVLNIGTPTAAESENRPNFLRRMGLEPIVIPHLTDTNDWFLIADPMDCPTIEVGFLGGREEPELFVQDMPNVGSMFTADKLTYKIRHIYGVVVLDYRGFYGQLN